MKQIRNLKKPKQKTKAMKARNIKTVIGLLSLLGSVTLAVAQGAAFTYQGRLDNGGLPYTGNAEFQPTLWNAPSGGTKIADNAPAQVVVGVTNGLFVLPLDFGANFPGADRWLQLEVRTTIGPFTTLSPRQKLAPAPYAITASNLSGTVPASQLTGTLPSANLGGTYSGLVTFNNAANSFSGSGAGLTGLNASQLTSGTVADSRLSSNVALRSGGNAFTGNQTVASGSVGIGTTTPGQPLHVAGSVQLDNNNGRLLLRTPTRNDPGRYGIQFSNNTLGLFLGDDTQEQVFGFYSGFSANRTNDASIQIFGRATNSWGKYLKLTHDGTNGWIVTDAGDLLISPELNVGIGTNDPQAKLHVAGDLRVDGNLTWATKTGYVAVAAAAFHPARSGLSYTNTGASLTALYVNSQFYAPVQLPNGATITRLTWAGLNPYDGAWGQVKLYRCNLAGTINEMASVDSSLSGAPQHDDTISYATVDNSQYQYYLRMELSGAWGYSAIIRYTWTKP